MVFLQGLVRESGPAVACLELFECEEVELLISNDVLLEIKDVLTRPKLRQKFPRLTEERVDTLIKTLLKKARFVGLVLRQFEYQRDPKDERYINLALAAGAMYLVSRDHDLLDLVDEQKPGGRAFTAKYPSLKILDPVAFLHVIAETRKWQGILKSSSFSPADGGEGNIGRVNRHGRVE